MYPAVLGFILNTALAVHSGTCRAQCITDKCDWQTREVRSAL